MKKIIAILFLTLFVKHSFAQNWVKKADLTDSTLTSYSGTYGISGGTSFSIGDTGYIVTGANGFSFFHETWIYNAATNTWDTVASFPYNENGSGGGVKAGFALNGNGYVGTGSFFGLPLTKEFYEYDPATDTWNPKAFMSVQRGYGVGFAISGRGFIGLGFGGVNVGTFGPPLYDFWEYNPNEGDSGTWTQILDYPGNGNQLSFAFTIGDKAYVGGGFDQNNNLAANDFWEFDTINKTWTRVATFPGGPRWQGASVSGCDKGYIGLGTNTSGNYVNDFWEFDPNKGDSGTWTQIASIPISGGRTTPEAFGIGKSIFVGMGSGPNGAVPDLWQYTPSVIPAFSAVTSVCQGGSITFKDTSNYSPSNWYWQFPGGTPDTSTNQNPTIVYDTAGTYNIILSAWNSCDSGSQTFTNYVTVGAGGILSIMPPHDTICSGQSVSLVITNAQGASFSWTPSVGLNDTTSDSVVATPTITTIYSVTATGTGGCGFQGIDSITVKPAFPMTIVPQDTLFCSGQSVTLYVSSGGSNFVWNPLAGLSADTGTFVVASPTSSTTYTVTGLNSYDCADTGTSIVLVVPSPNKPTFYQHGDTLISSSKTDNQWYFNGTMLNDDTSQNLIITTVGNYWVNVVNEANGCSTTSDTTKIDTVNGINQLSGITNQLSIYPNPFSNDVFIKINSSVENVKDWNLQITDVLGRTIYSKLSLDYNNDIDLADLSSGMYFITVINKAGRGVFPVVRQN